MKELTSLIVMARWPAPGRCKRRLANDLSITAKVQYPNVLAARLQNKLSLHTLSLVSKLNNKRLLDPILAVSGIGLRAAKRWGNYFGIDKVQLQGKGGLGLRIRRLLISKRRKNSGILLIGSDLPTLNTYDLLNAIESLKVNDLILGPSKDGGYWLIGLSLNLLNRPQSWPLCGIPWGSSEVLETTLKQANSNNLSIKLIPTRQDIDNLKDLRKWLD